MILGWLKTAYLVLPTLLLSWACAPLLIPSAVEGPQKAAPFYLCAVFQSAQISFPCGLRRSLDCARDDERSVETRIRKTRGYLQTYPCLKMAFYNALTAIRQ